ncbi:MAG: hypothetical protein RIC12_01415 [Pirellulales bacterium]
MTTTSPHSFTIGQLLKGMVFLSLLLAGAQGALYIPDARALGYLLVFCFALGGLMGVKSSRVVETGFLGMVGFLLGLLMIAIGF